MHETIPLRLLVFLIVVWLMAGCATARPEKDDQFVFAGIGGANHTDRFIYRFAVDGAMGMNKSAYSAESANTCCVRLPRVWRPGLSVTVDWNMPIGVQDNWKRKEVPVEQYAEAEDVYVHFFPNDEIRVVVSRAGPGGSLHPIPYPIDPRNARP